MQKTPLWFAICLFLAACSGCSNVFKPVQPAATPTPPLAAVSPGETFATGQSLLPKGQYLLLELTADEECASECNCAPIQPVRDIYRLSPQGELWLDPALAEYPTFRLPDPARPADILGFFGDDRFTNGGKWHEEMASIIALPYEIQQNPEMRVLSIDAAGTGILEVRGTAYHFRPGETWSESEDIQRESPPGCRMRYTTRLANRGLLAQEQIHLGDPYNYR